MLIKTIQNKLNLKQNFNVFQEHSNKIPSEYFKLSIYVLLTKTGI